MLLTVCTFKGKKIFEKSKLEKIEIETKNKFLFIFKK
jgi:hypothetical protein